MREWEEFKSELIDIKKKYQLLKENLTNNNLKLKETASEWALQYIVKGFREDNYIYICELAKIALVTPVTKAWPERGASAVKRVKSRMRSTMKNDLLHISLYFIYQLMTHMQIIRRLTSYQKEYAMLLQMKSTRKYHKSTAQEKLKLPLQLTESNLESTVENCEEETSCLKFVQPDFYRASFMISNFTEEEFSEEDDNVSDVEVV